VNPEELAQLEPHARAIDGLYSPETGVVDFAVVARAYARDVRDAGGTIATGWAVADIHSGARALRLSSPDSVLEAGNAIFCAGAWADRLARSAGASADPRIVPFRGTYLRVRTERRELVRALIYPVPDPALPFLGTHLSRRIDGDVLIGPTALIAGARDGYGAFAARPADLLDTLAWPGTWRMLRRWWRTGATELRHALFRSALVRAAARYVPELGPGDVEPAGAGIRAQALARDGRLLDDFVFTATERALHVRNAPSPAATASLAIARHIADQARGAFGLS
jgi:L-2-hydroxyglutarate oxidase